MQIFFEQLYGSILILFIYQNDSLHLSLNFANRTGTISIITKGINPHIAQWFKITVVETLGTKRKIKILKFILYYLHNLLQICLIISEFHVAREKNKMTRVTE